VRLFVFLHVLTMFAAVAVTGGGDLLMVRIARTRDVPAIRTAFTVYERIGPLVPILFLAGLVFGITAIFVHGFDPFAPWLLLAYPLFVAGFAIGGGVTGPWVGRVARAASTSGEAPSPELEAAISDPRARYGLVVFYLLIAAIIFVMVVKPLS
jgi:Predicted integral membrane protein (DUF2269)